MSGVRLAFSFNDTSLREALRRKLARLEDKAPLLKLIGEEFVSAGGIINRRFKEERGPDGKPWAPLSPRTIASRLKRKGNSPITMGGQPKEACARLSGEPASRRFDLSSGGVVRANVTLCTSAK